MSLLRGRECVSEGIHSFDGCGPLYAGGLGHAFQVTAGRSCGRKTTDRKQALIVKDDMYEVCWLLPRNRGEPAKIHEHRAVAVEDYDLLIGQTQRQPQPRGRSKAHGMLKVEEARAMPQRLQLRSNRPHDGDDQAILQLIVDGSQALEALHHGRYASSHMSSRVRSSAVGCSML